MLTNLSGLLATLIALSVAAERLVGIVKNFSAYLSTENNDANGERKRKLILQLLALLAGMITAYLAEIAKVLPADLPRWPLLGLLASGGSGFWTSILGYVNSIKDIQKNIAIDTKAQAAANLKALAYREATQPLVAPALIIQRAGAGLKGSPLPTPTPPLSSAAQIIADEADKKLNDIIKAGLARL